MAGERSVARSDRRERREFFSAEALGATVVLQIEFLIKSRTE